MSKKLPTKKKAALKPAESADLVPALLVDELRDLIRTTRSEVAQSVNTALVLLYWQVGTRIRTEVLKDERADYGKEIVSTLSRRLAEEFGTGFSRPNLFKMLQFAECFADAEIVSTLSRQLSWSHFVEVIRLEHPLKRDFYVLRLDESGIHVATYLTELPPIETLREKLHESIERARQRLENKPADDGDEGN